MDNTLQQLIEELKTTTYNSRPNIKYQDQMDLIERLENELKNYKLDLPPIKYESPTVFVNNNEPIILESELSIENIVEPVIDFEPNHYNYPVENPVLIPKQKGRKPKES